MKTASTYLRQHEDKRPWIILGKGPSAIKWIGGQVRRANYNTIAINDACQMQDVEHAIFIDIEAMRRCEPILGNLKSIFVPWHMHENESPMKRDIVSLANSEPVIKKNFSRLAFFLLNSKDKGPNSIRCNTKTASAAFQLVARWARNSDHKVVYSLGVDGGKGHAAAFEDIKRAHPHHRYDDQFKEIKEASQKYGKKLSPI